MVPRIGLRAILKKALTVVAVFYLILTVTFIVVQASPPRPVLMGPPPDSIDRANAWRIAEDLRLNDSLAVQYIDFLSDMTRGDLSLSLTGDEVSGILADCGIGTVFLLLSVLLLSVLVGAPVSMYLSRRRSRSSAKVLSMLFIVITAVPVSGLGIVLLLLDPWSAAQAATATGAEVLHLPASDLQGWASMLSMVQSSGIPLLAALVPTLGMYVVLFSHVEGGMSGTRAPHSKATPLGMIREYVATVLGPAMPLPLFFVSWAMCCVIAAETACSFGGLGTVLWYAALHLDLAVLRATVVAISVVVLVTILSVQFMMWSASHRTGAAASSQSFVPSAATGRSNHLGLWRFIRDDALVFVKGVFGSYRRSKAGMAALVTTALLCALALLAPNIATVEDPGLDMNSDDVLLPPSFEPSEATGIVHLFGTDILGRDLYSMILSSVGATMLLLGVVFAVSMVTYLSMGWLRRASASVGTRARGLSGQLFKIVSLVFLSIPIVVLIFCLKISSFTSFEPVVTASVFALVMSLWGWELLITSGGRDVSAGRDSERSHSTRMVLADSLRASKLTVLVAMPAFTVLPLWFSSDAGLFTLMQSIFEWAAPTSSWWTVVFPVAWLVLLTVSAYVILDVIEKSIRRPDPTIVPGVSVRAATDG